MKPEIKEFSREKPCTKVDIWNTFRGPNGFLRVPVVLVQSKIGVNVPRVMVRGGRLLKKLVSNVDYYYLTASGEQWLSEGLLGVVKRHPEFLDSINHHPKEWCHLRVA